MKKMIALILSATIFCTSVFASSVGTRRPFPYEQGVALAKNVLYINARELSAGAGLNTMWSDTFKDSTQINSGSSTGYTYRGSSNFDVILNASGSTKESQTTDSTLSAQIISNTAACVKGAGSNFTAASSYSLGSTKFSIDRFGSPTGNIRAVLYAATAGLPTGSALAVSADVNVASLSTSKTQVTFSYSVPYSVVSGTDYVVMLEVNGAYSGNGSNYVSVYGTGAGSDVGKSATDVYTAGISTIYFLNTESAASTAVVRSVTTTFASAVSEVMVFVDMTLNTGAVSLVRVSANSGSTWKTVTNNLEQVVSLGHSGTGVILEVTFTGDAELEFWGVSA